MTKVLITGGAGFIGGNLARALAARGHDVTVLDNLSEQIHGATPETSPLYRNAAEVAKVIVGTVEDRATLETALADQEVVVHFAAETGTGQSMYQVDHYTKVNIGATALLFDVLGHMPHSVRRFVVASSRSIYGEGTYRRADGSVLHPPHRAKADMEAGLFDPLDLQTRAPLTMIPTDEDARIHPSSVYGITKQVQEQLTMTVAPLLGIEPVALRYQNVYGPGQSLSNPYTGILSIFANLIMKGEGINIFEDGLESRDFVFIDDVVDATVRSIEMKEAAGGVFNVGSGVATTVNTVVDELQACFGSSVPVTVSGNFRLGDIRHNVADLTRIRARLGFEPKVTFAEGIRRFVAWARTQGPTASAYKKSLQEMKERKLLN